MIYNLQILRAFAALNVVLFHVIGTSSSYGFEVIFLSLLEGWGANGVDVFFVISGFVMLHSQMRVQKNVKSFYLTRLIRIVPIYWTLTSFLICLYWIFPSAFNSLELSLEWTVSSYLFSSLFFMEKFPILYQGWTLEWEIYFYLVFGVGLIFRRWSIFVTLVFIIICLTSLYSGNYIAIEFLFGMVIALMYKNVQVLPRNGVALMLLGLFFLSLSAFSLIKEAVTERILIWGIPSAILVFGALKAKQYDSKLLNFLGDASYSIYLVQVFTIPAFYKVWARVGLSIQTDLLALICVAATAAFGCLIYVFLEKPLTKALRRKILGAS